MANEIKTRDPQAELYHNDYLTWINNTVDWLGTQVAEADYPAHLAPNLAPLVPAFADALDSWHTLNELAIGRNEIFTNVFDALRNQLQLIKESLPTVAAGADRAAGAAVIPSADQRRRPKLDLDLRRQGRSVRQCRRAGLDRANAIM